MKKMKKIIFPFFITLVFITLVFFKFHPSSIGIYHQYLYGDKSDKNLIFGQVRSIRSDEWLVITPKILSQFNSDFSFINKNIGFGEVMPVQGCYPYKHWRILFCPHNWGFLIMPLEIGYAFFWWSISFIMMMAVYFFVLNFLKNIFLSLSASLIFLFSPFNQWWSYILSPFLGYGLFFILFFIKSLENKNIIKSIIYFILSVYFFVSFVFILYPPFQVASLYVFFAFLAGYLISKKILFSKKTFIYTLILILSTAFFVFLFFNEFKETINVIRNTVYPGKRFIANTLGSFAFLINGFYNIQLLDDLKGSGPFPNQSEASNFFLISFFALPVYFWVLLNQIKNKKIDYVFLFLNIVFIMLLIWFLFPIPSILAKVSFLYLVPQKRAIIGIGICAYILMFYYLARIKFKKDFFYVFLVFISSLIIFFVNLYFGFWLKFNYPSFIQNNLKILFISSFSAFLLFVFLMKYLKIFLISFLVFSFISTYRVNPLYKGLDPLINTPLAKEIKKINDNYQKKYGWVYYGSIYLENYFIANGLRSLNGTYYYPQFLLWNKFDKEKKYEYIYNRYGHLTLFNDKTKEKFTMYGEDHFGLNIDPCDDVLRENNYRFVVIENIDNNLSNNCLIKIKNIDRFSIYFIK